MEREGPVEAGGGWRTKLAAGLAVLAAVGLVGGWGVAMRGRPETLSLPASTPAAKGKATSPRPIHVHVAGAVERPGLYRLPANARVDDAVAMAGGPAGDADLDAVNLAARIRDGDKVTVPVQGGDGGSGAEATEGSGKVNLNTATVADLETLPGIGPSLAQRIVEHRTKTGGFRTVEDLRKVAGIGDKKFADLADLVTV